MLGNSNTSYSWSVGRSWRRHTRPQHTLLSVIIVVLPLSFSLWHVHYSKHFYTCVSWLKEFECEQWSSSSSASRDSTDEWRKITIIIISVCVSVNPPQTHTTTHTNNTFKHKLDCWYIHAFSPQLFMTAYTHTHTDLTDGWKDPEVFYRSINCATHTHKHTLLKGQFSQKWSLPSLRICSMTQQWFTSRLTGPDGDHFCKTEQESLSASVWTWTE